MEKSPSVQYRYFSRSFKIELALFMLFGPALTSLWAITGYYYYYSGRLSIPLVKSAVYFTATLIFSLIFYSNARAISSGKSVVIEKDRIMKKSLRGTTFVHWADIVGIRRINIPLVKRWFALVTQSGGVFTLPLHVHGGREMVENVFGSLRERGQAVSGSGQTDEDNLRSIAEHINVLQDQRIANVPWLLRVITISAVFHCAVAIIFWESGLMFTMIWGITNMFTQTAAYFIAERLHIRKLLRGGTDGGSYLLAAVTALFAGMAAAILITEPIY